MNKIQHQPLPKPGHFQVFSTSHVAGTVMWMSALAHMVHTSEGMRAFFLCASPSCPSIPVVPWWAQTLTWSLASKQTAKCASDLALLWSSHAAGVTTVLQPGREPARTGGGDGEAKLCQEWAWGMQQRSHCRAGTDTCRSFQACGLLKLLDGGLSQSLGNGQWAMTCTHCIFILLSICQIQ